MGVFFNWVNSSGRVEIWRREWVFKWISHWGNIILIEMLRFSKRNLNWIRIFNLQYVKIVKLNEVNYNFWVVLLILIGNAIFNVLNVYISLIGCCTRFSCTLVKWCSHLAKITIPTGSPSTPSPPLQLDEQNYQQMRSILANLLLSIYPVSI